MPRVRQQENKNSRKSEEKQSNGTQILEETLALTPGSTAPQAELFRCLSSSADSSERTGKTAGPHADENFPENLNTANNDASVLHHRMVNHSKTEIIPPQTAAASSAIGNSLGRLPPQPSDRPLPNHLNADTIEILLKQAKDKLKRLIKQQIQEQRANSSSSSPAHSPSTKESDGRDSFSSSATSSSPVSSSLILELTEEISLLEYQLSYIRSQHRSLFLIVFSLFFLFWLFWFLWKGNFPLKEILDQWNFIENPYLPNYGRE